MEIENKVDVAEPAAEQEEQIGLVIEINAVPVINYALQLNGIKAIRSITLRNVSGKDLENIDLIISSEPEFVLPKTEHVQYLQQGREVVLSGVDITLNGTFLAARSERTEGLVTVKAIIGGAECASAAVPVSVLAMDEWSGSSVYPEMLSAFVTPNDPALVPLLATAAGMLEEWTGDPSLDGYQSQNADRILKQAGAAYAALQKENIVYAVPPASFETRGQRVRLCGEVLKQKMGTCLDLTLAYTSCLEQMGLNPLLVLVKGHIFAGVWLDDLSFPEAIQDDPSLLSKRLAGGVNEMAVVECTLLCAGKNASFDEARKAAEQRLLELADFDFVIDVRRARLNGIRPISVIRSGEYEILRDEAEVTAVPETIASTVDVSQIEETPATRKTRWERKLLDLGLRNTLISMRMSKTLVPFLCHSVDALEDALFDGSDFQIYSSPEGWREENRDISFESVQNILGKKDALESEFSHKRLRSVFTENELEKNIRELYRTSKSSIEENGANTLYMALGLLRWYESPRSTKARYAPLVLIPIEMVRRSASLGYVIRLRDEEPQMNITLLEKLKQDFGMEIGGLDPLPLDDHGVDIRKVFTIMRKAVMDNKNWDVLESAYLGIFSFSQFVMWNDIRNRSDDLSKNKVVKSLMEGRLVWDTDEMETGNKVEEGGVLLPISADASQLFAIKEAAEGESFVLHGPPGTGKSQTITAMIANALAAGKTVLFVAEKMAALEVVQKRLDKIGLGPFCLELHSNKSRKRDVLEQLKNATEVLKTKNPQEYEIKTQQIVKLRGELDEYAQALHSEQNCGLSLYDIIGRYETCKDAVDIKPFSVEFAKSVTLLDLDSQRTVIERLVAAAKLAGHPAANPLRGIGIAEYSQKNKADLEKTSADFRIALEAFGEPLDAFLSGFGVSGTTLEDLKEYAVVSAEYPVWTSLPENWAKEENMESLLGTVTDAANSTLAVKAAGEGLKNTWQDDFLSLNGKELLAQYREACGKWALAKMMGVNSFVRKLEPYSKSKLSKEDIEGEIQKLIGYQELATDAEEKVGRCMEKLGSLYAGKDTDWNVVLEKAELARTSAARLSAVSCGNDLRIRFFGNRSEQDTASRYADAFGRLSSAFGAFNAVAIADGYDGDDWPGYNIRLTENIRDNFDTIKEWITWNSIAAEAREAGLSSVVDAYYDGIEHEQVIPAYSKAIYMAIANEIIDRTPAISNFSGAIFDEKVSQLRAIDSRLMKLAQDEIYCRLAAKVPNFAKEAAHSSELGILQRAIKSGGRGLSIRKLFEQIPNMLPRLCPCILMSPISAAQYLDPNREPFDIVIFDEASQLPTCKAVGALARGKDAVIVGDPKQMPPTSFFATNMVDEDNFDIEDLESILDDCLALNMPQTHLLWHYRSRHESLIAFSNSQFYENKLYTFPSVNDLERKVTLVPVEGVFERGKNRSNRAEAEAIIEELTRRAHDESISGFSVGVVTFNINQQTLIDDMLADACKNDPVLEKWAYESEEPLFIKNLENVQGDERDVILFSVGYGPDANGKVSMNFGPLNREGGWRRLNVAVSRARCEMTVFSTLRPEQINLERTSAEGVAALKSFLEYASGKELAQKYDEDSTFETTGIIDSICAVLNEKGYETRTFVGHSKYRIDIGVVDPDDPDRYILGILLDGNTYKESKTTRDREMAQIDVLKGLGWNIMRVWTMDWWDNSFKEMTRILDRVTFCKEEPEEAAEEKAEEVSAAETEDFNIDEIAKLADSVALPEAKDLPVIAKGYKAWAASAGSMTPDEFIMPENVNKIADSLFNIIVAEAPITESLLIKRVVQSFGISRTGSRIMDYLKTVLSLINWPITEKDGQKVYWNASQKPDEYYLFRPNGSGVDNRDVREVPFAEVRNALCLVLHEQISLSHDDAIRESARKMNYTRLGANVTSVYEAVLTDCVNRGLISAGANGTFILTDAGNELVKLVQDGLRK